MGLGLGLGRWTVLERCGPTACGTLQSRLHSFWNAHIFTLCSTAAALTCYCSDCSRGNECTGDLCYAQVVNGQRRWRCYNRAFSYLCNTTSVFHTTLCCDSADRCNENLHPMESTLSQPTPATTASSSTPSQVVQPSYSPTESTLAPLINPSTGSESSNSEPTSSPLNASSE